MIEWRRLSNEVIVSRFAKRDWNNIFSGITTDEELRDHLQVDFASGYVAYSEAGIPIAIALLIEEYWRGNQVQVHGGCWSGSAWDSYSAIITLIEQLFADGKAVRSQCSLDNERTTRFLKSVGFINHYTSDSYRHFWLPHKRFVNTAMYKRFHS